MKIVGIGGIFIDDIVLPDGITHMGQLGGAVIHALMGAALWANPNMVKPGLLGFAGAGFPDDAENLLNTYLDTSGLIRLALPQARAWQVFEHDGTRRELHRVKNITPFVRGPQPADMIDGYHEAQGYYLLQDFEGIRAWSDVLSGVIFWEPSQLVMLPENADVFRRTLHDVHIDVVSPNLIEAKHIYGDLSPDALVDAMLTDGAEIVALRMGEHGSLVASTSERFTIPAIAVPHIVDQTGAGNTYCGAMLLGMLDGKDLKEAATMGAVAASFNLETMGVMIPDGKKWSKRDSRLHSL